jgi:tetratricopeptide (TPR) repeat protein
MTERFKMGWLFPMSERMKIGLLLAAVALVYGNALRNQFTQDDGLYIELNPAVVQPTMDRLWGPNEFTSIFRPVTFITLALNYQIGGLHPWGYHLVNLLLHAGVCWLLYLLLCAIFGDSAPAKLAALVTAWLFALHPIHTEAVTSAVGRSELLAAGLLLAAWLLHLRDHEIAALVCFALALLSKESAVVFLPLVMLGDFFRGRWKPLLRYVWIAGVTVAYVALLYQVQGGRFGAKLFPPLDNPLVELSVSWRIVNALRVAWKYVALQIYPATLSCDYSFNSIPVYMAWGPNLLSAIAFLAVTAAWTWAIYHWVTRAAQRTMLLGGAILGCGIYLIAFATTSNILLYTGTIMGERLAYLPSAGFCLLIALAWSWLHSRYRNLALGVMALICALLAARTVVRNRDWYDNFTLFSAAVQAVPQSAKAHNNLGAVYMARKQNKLAKAEFETALRIHPDYPDALASYGLMAFLSNDLPNAERAMDRALGMSRRENHNYDFMAVNYAALLLQTGRPDAALTILDREIAEAPGYGRAWANRAVIRFQRGEVAAARSDAETALRLEPDNLQARNVLRLLSR